MALVCLVVAAAAGRDSATAAVGIGVSPAYQVVAISPNQPTQAVTITYYNRTSEVRGFKLSTADFGTLDESGGVAFLGRPASELDHKYGLASWMRLSTDTLYIPAGLSQDVTVSIDNRASLSPGGHYGAVLATNLGEAQGGSGANVGIKQVISALILLNKDGGAAPQLKLDRESLNDRLWRLPTEVVQRFQNTGNVHVVPRGTVEVRDPTGKLVERAVINDDSGVILPESFRKYTTRFISTAPAVLPGAYRVTSSYRFDGLDTFTTHTSTIWYAGEALVWLGTAIICLVVSGLLWWWLYRKRRHRS